MSVLIPFEREMRQEPRVRNQVQYFSFKNVNVFWQCFYTGM